MSCICNGNYNQIENILDLLNNRKKVCIIGTLCPPFIPIINGLNPSVYYEYLSQTDVTGTLVSFNL